MTEFKHPEQALRQFRNRLMIAGGVVLVFFLILLSRLIWLQLLSYDKYRSKAEDNRITIVPLVPNRGMVLDRNHQVLASNYSAYTLEVTPSKIPHLDETIAQLSQLVSITPVDLRRFKKLRNESKRFESIPIRTRLTDEEVARFAVQSYRFPGIELRARLFRQYPYNTHAAHVLGYIGRISERDQQQIEDMNAENNYRGTVYIGKEGLEKQYEKELHGHTGFEEIETSAAGRAVRVLSRSPAVPGQNLVLGIDIELQTLAEESLQDRRGALVALDPNNGNILALVSHPSFDPNLFVEGIDPENWKALNESPDRPLLNRPLVGSYPPGSTFKPFMALAALEKGYRTPSFAILDPGHFDFGGRRFMDDKPGGHGWVNMYHSIVDSCNTYYYMLGSEMGIDAISSFMKQFGFGQKTGIDLGGERPGTLPSREWKMKTFKRPETQRWYSGETISVAIGQGYNHYTPIQMAHAVGILATGGVIAPPRLVTAFQNPLTQEIIPKPITNLQQLQLDPKSVDFIKKAMQGVALEGTARGSFSKVPYTIGGKTGTAQVFSLKEGERYKNRALTEQLKDHSWFVAFSPVDKPKIAIAVIVENGGFGAQAAAPVVRKLLDGFWAKEHPELIPQQATASSTNNAASTSVAAPQPQRGTP